MNKEFIDAVKVATKKMDITIERMEETIMKKKCVPGPSSTALPINKEMTKVIRELKRIATNEIADSTVPMIAKRGMSEVRMTDPVLAESMKSWPVKDMTMTAKWLRACRIASTQVRKY